MAGHSILLTCIHVLIITESLSDYKFTKGIDCSLDYQNLCSVNQSTLGKESKQACGCGFVINVCPSSDNDILFSYKPPLEKYGIAEGNVFLNLYEGTESKEYDMFRISLSQKYPCRFTRVLPGEYEIWMSPIDPSHDYPDYEDNCDCFGYNFQSDKFFVNSNITEIITTGPKTTTAVRTSSYVVTTTGSTDALWNINESTSGGTDPNVGVVPLSLPSGKQESHTGGDGLIKTNVIIVITASSTCLLLISLTILASLRKRCNLCRTYHTKAVINHDSAEVKKSEEHQKGKESDTTDKLDSGIHDWESAEGFLNSDVATLRERCGPTSSVIDMYGCTSLQNDNHDRDPSIYPALTILGGTLEKTNFVHPLFYGDSSQYVSPWIPCSNCSVNLHQLQNHHTNQRDEQALSDTQNHHTNQRDEQALSDTQNHHTNRRDEQALSDTQHLEQRLVRHEGTPNGVIAQGCRQCDTRSQKHVDTVQNVNENSFEFVPPDPILSECNDITSRIIEQGMLEINRHYCRTVPSLAENIVNGPYITGARDPETDRTRCDKLYIKEDTLSSDVSISGISL
ncbi:uncharacterized protein LOC117331292 [Pecten maximus]|uniref:uncharacterized protein LOC117331292 n=1 Tax=Pecten maximus TaxID=6579 RepID=UPI001457EE3F|nr:uncharacterized protein LOC117331292 [Pecten maximus]